MQGEAFRLDRFCAFIDSCRDMHLKAGFRAARAIGSRLSKNAKSSLTTYVIVAGGAAVSKVMHFTSIDLPSERSGNVLVRRRFFKRASNS